MEETLRSYLLSTARLFEAETGISLASIGKRALNDNTFFPRVESGHGFTVGTYDRVVGWLRENWPDGQAMPSEDAIVSLLPPPSSDERSVA